MILTNPVVMFTLTPCPEKQAEIVLRQLLRVFRAKPLKNITIVIGNHAFLKISLYAQQTYSQVFTLIRTARSGRLPFPLDQHLELPNRIT